IEVVTGSLTAIEADAVVMNLFEGVQRPGGATGAVDREIGGALTRVIEAGDFRGKLGQTVTVYPEGKPFRRVIMVGLGPADSFTLEQARLAAAAAVKAAGRGGVRRLATIVHGAGIGG